MEANLLGPIILLSAPTELSVQINLNQVTTSPDLRPKAPFLIESSVSEMPSCRSLWIIEVREESSRQSEFSLYRFIKLTLKRMFPFDLCYGVTKQAVKFLRITCFLFGISITVFITQSCMILSSCKQYLASRSNFGSADYSLGKFQARLSKTFAAWLIYLTMCTLCIMNVSPVLHAVILTPLSFEHSEPS